MCRSFSLELTKVESQCSSSSFQDTAAAWGRAKWGLPMLASRKKAPGTWDAQGRDPPGPQVVSQTKLMTSGRAFVPLTPFRERVSLNANNFR